MPHVEFNVLTGKTITEIAGGENGSERIEFNTSDGCSYAMFHSQDCCEHVILEDIIGDIEDLLDSPILLAEEVFSDEPDETMKAQREVEKAEQEKKYGYCYGPDSETWTFYKLSTIKGSVTFRWYGTSNGYYSERADFRDISDGTDWY